MVRERGKSEEPRNNAAVLGRVARKVSVKVVIEQRFAGDFRQREQCNTGPVVQGRPAVIEGQLGCNRTNNGSKLLVSNGAN